MQLTGISNRVVDFGLLTASLANAAQITFLVTGIAHAGLQAGSLQFGNNGADVRVSGDAFANSAGGCVSNVGTISLAPMFIMAPTATKFKNVSGGAYTNLHIGGFYYA